MRVVGVDYDHRVPNPTPEDRGAGERYNKRWPGRPKLLLQGATSYQGRQMSKMNGSVRMTPDGEVRWDIVSGSTRLFYVSTVDEILLIPALT